MLFQIDISGYNDNFFFYLSECVLCQSYLIKPKASTNIWLNNSANHLGICTEIGRNLGFSTWWNSFSQQS